MNNYAWGLVWFALGIVFYFDGKTDAFYTALIVSQIWMASYKKKDD